MDQAARLGSAYRLGLLARPQGGPAGRVFGRGTGSSLEFHDFRDYQAGDDLRHVDWRSYARTETLTTRLYREEIAPVLEIVLDASRSMRLSEAKFARLCALACFLAAAAAQSECRVKAVVAGDAPHPLPAEALRTEELPGFACASSASLMHCPLGGLLGAGASRVVLSDFLFPHDSRDLVQRLGARAGSLALVQVLDSDEVDPPQRGTMRLIEEESGTHLDLPVDGACVRRYQERLERLWSGLGEESRRAGGLSARVLSEEPLHEAVLDTLVPAGLVEPA